MQEWVEGQEGYHEDKGQGSERGGVDKAWSIKIDLPQPSNNFEGSRCRLLAIRDLELNSNYKFEAKLLS